MSDLSNVFLIDVDDLQGEMSDPRIHSIDALKGLAIILVITAHTAFGWLHPDWYWLFGIIYTFLDVFGPSLFYTLSAIGVCFSVHSKRGVLPEKEIRNRVLRRGATLIVIGAVYNLIIQLGTNLPFYLAWWGWSIIFAIGFAQITTYYAMKLSKLNRAILALICIYIGTRLHDILLFRFGIVTTSDPLIFSNWPIDELADFTNGYAVLYFILYQMAFMEPILPWVAYSLLGSLVGESLIDAMDKGTKQAYQVFQRETLFLGLFLTLGGIIAGLELMTTADHFYGFGTYPIIIGQTAIQQGAWSPLVDLPGIPEFLVHGTAPNMLYNFGVAVLLESIFFNRMEVKQHNKGAGTAILEFYGKLSLSIFFVHQFLLVIVPPFKNALGPVPWLFGLIAVIILCGVIMGLWIKYGKGIGTFEYVVILVNNFSIMIDRYLRKRGKWLQLKKRRARKKGKEAGDAESDQPDHLIKDTTEQGDSPAPG